MTDSFVDPVGVFDQYDSEQRKKLEETMGDLVEAETEWVQTGAGKRLKMTCPECDDARYFETRPATARCGSCMRIMQAKDYDMDPNNPDPENPDWYLEKLAKSRGLSADEYKDQSEQKSARSW